jgi:hypothetical protein
MLTVNAIKEGKKKKLTTLSNLTNQACLEKTKMSFDLLKEQEQRISSQYMCINPPASTDWYNTIDAIFKIKKEKLYLPHYKSLHMYLNEKWNITSRATFNNLAVAGEIISKLRQARIVDLPSNVAICLAIQKTSIKYLKDVAQVWNFALETFENSKNVISNDIFSMYQETTVSPPQTSPMLPSSPPTPDSADTSTDIEGDGEGSDSDRESLHLSALSFRKRKLLSQTASTSGSESSEESSEDEIVNQDRYSHIRRKVRLTFAENGNTILI